ATRKSSATTGRTQVARSGWAIGRGSRRANPAPAKYDRRSPSLAREDVRPEAGLIRSRFPEAHVRPIFAPASQGPIARQQDQFSGGQVIQGLVAVARLIDKGSLKTAGGYTGSGRPKSCPTSKFMKSIAFG